MEPREILSQRSSSALERAEAFDFAVADRKGRAIGVRVEFWTETFVEFTPPTSGSYGFSRLAPGTYSSWETHGLRDGALYGPLQGRNYCATPAARALEVARFLKSARARAHKTYGAGAPEVRP